MISIHKTVRKERGGRDAVSEDARANIVKMINVLSSSENAKSDTIKLLQENPQINAIVTFNEWTTLGVDAL